MSAPMCGSRLPRIEGDGVDECCLEAGHSRPHAWSMAAPTTTSVATPRCVWANYDIFGRPRCRLAEGHQGPHCWVDPVTLATPTSTPDPVTHPAHYRSGGIEAIDVIEAFGLGFRLGNVLKYLLRAGRKGVALEDLKKARFYLDREISRLESGR